MQTSYDAAFILLYLAGRLPELPWVYDTVPPFGKAPITVPTAIVFGNSLTGSENNLVTVPIMAQGNGAIGAEFTMNYGPNVHLISVEPVKTYENGSSVELIENNNKIAIALVGNYTTPTTIANAIFEIDGNKETQNLTTSGMTINREIGRDISTSLNPEIGSTNMFAFPNPFNSENGIQIQYSTVSDGFVGLEIYDVLGNEVRTLVSNVQMKGNHLITFDGKNDANVTLPSGVYYYRLNADGITLTKQMSLLNNDDFLKLL